MVGCGFRGPANIRACLLGSVPFDQGSLALRHGGQAASVSHLAVGQNQWHPKMVGAPHILEPILVLGLGSLFGW